jgi:hypothetical protein
MEGDAKVCIDSISQCNDSVLWKVMSLIFNVKCTTLMFFSCPFCWVQREVNKLAHSLAKFVSTQHVYPLCIPSNLPPSAREALLA